MTNIKSSNEVFGISKDDAYEIIGGYKAADGETLAAAIKIMEEEALSSDIAARLLTLYKSNMSLKSIDFNEISDAQLEKGLDNAIEFTRKEKDYINNIFNDKTNNSYTISTKLIDVNGNEASVKSTDNTAVLLARLATEEVKRKLITGQIDGLDNIQESLNAHFANKYESLRISALKDVSGADMEDASDAKKPVYVLAENASKKFSEGQQAIKEFDRSAEKRIEKSSPKAKNFWRKLRTTAVAFLAFSLSYTFSSCSNSTKQNAPQTQEIRDDSLKVNITPIVELKDSVQNVKTDTAQNDTIKTNAFVYVTKEKTGLIDYINKSFPELGYEGAYKKIQENIDKFSGISDNPDVILNAYRFATSAPSWEVKHGEVAKVARELGNWLQPCNGETVEFPQNIDAMFIQQFDGTLDGVRVTGYDNCDDKMMVEESQTKVKDEPAPVEEVKEVADTIPSFTEADPMVIGERDNVIEEQQSITMTEKDGNQGLTDGKPVKEGVDVAEANREVKGADEHKVLVKEQADTAKVGLFSATEAEAIVLDASAQVSAQAAAVQADAQADVQADNSDASVEQDDIAPAKKKKAANLRKEMKKKADRAAKQAVASDGAEVATPVFAEAEAVVVSAGETKSAEVAAPVFAEAEAVVVNTAEATQVSAPQAATPVETAVASEDASNQAPTKGGDKEEIIFGVDSVEIGTPSAGYVAERGGYKNSGLTKEQYNRTYTYFEDKYGKGATEAYCAKINANDGLLLQNGQIGAGWVDMELLFAWMNTENWGSNNPNNKNADQTLVTVNNILERYFDEKCNKDSLTQDETSLILEKFSNVTNTSRIFGIKGDKAIRTVSQRATDDCDKPSTHVYENTGSKRSAPYGKPLARLFFNTFVPVPAFVETNPVVIGVRDNVLTVQEAIVLNELNGNEGLTDGKVIKTNVSVAEANRTVKDADKHKVLVKDAKASTGFVAEEFNGNAGLTDGKDLGSVDLGNGVEVASKGSKVLVNNAGAKASTAKKSKKQKHLTFKIFKKKKMYEAKMAKKKAQQKAAEGNEALLAWAEKVNN